MSRPLSPIVLIAIFLAVVIAAVLMFSIVLARQDEPATSTPHDALALQLALIRDGDVVGLRLTFTERLRPSITREAVEAARPGLAQVGIADLVSEVRERELEGGGREALLVMPEGRTLTRLVLVGGNWLADTVWFE